MVLSLFHVLLWQGNRQMGAAEATTVHLQLCLEPGTEDHRAICLDRSIDFGGQAETLLVLTGLVPSVHYEPSVWACLHCSDKLCASVRTKSSLWWLYRGKYIYIQCTYCTLDQLRLANGHMSPSAIVVTVSWFESITQLVSTFQEPLRSHLVKNAPVLTPQLAFPE